MSQAISDAQEKTEVVEDWIALNLVAGLGARTARALLNKWHTPTAIFHARDEELAAAGLSAELIKSLKSCEPRREAESHCRRLETMGARALTLNLDQYP